MSLNFNEFSPYIGFITPPLVGAFIGYLTNRVAIRMLFRPLRQWHIGPVRVPMTPGVIPSKRHELAVNIGEMVGEHLLTSDEINNSLQKSGFQDHLYRLIEAKVGSFMKKDLGPLKSLVSNDYRSYFDIAQKTVTYQIKETVSEFVSSEQCTMTIEQSVSDWLNELFSRELNDLVSPDLRGKLYESFDLQVQQILHRESMEHVLEDVIYTKLIESVNSDTSLKDLLPQSLMDSVISVIDQQTPELLRQGVKILEEPEIQQKLVDAIVKGIEEFIETLGPMAAMVQNFLDMTMVEEKILEYFNEKQDEIALLLTSEEVRLRVSQTLTSRAHELFDSSVKSITSQQNILQLRTFSKEVAAIIVSGLRAPQSVNVINSLFKNHLEDLIGSGKNSLGDVVTELFGKGGVARSEIWFTGEISDLLKSAKTKKVIDHILENMIEQLLEKPVGRLANLVPAGVRDGLYKSLQQMATKMLTSEVPGIVKSLNIRKIVTDRIDSFDLLRLEMLLLSIMEEQFKYINIFGGLLGFLIGSINVLFITGILG